MSEESVSMNKLELDFYTIEQKKLWPYIFHQIKAESMKNDCSVDEAKKTINKNLNRYRDVNPYDHSRVILSKDDYSYINASHIIVEEADRKYILTQGPLPNTILHFWLMVWEQNSKAVIMLNKVVEKNQMKCSQYWPNSTAQGEDKLELPEINLRVELLCEKNHSHYIVRNLRLINMDTTESREIFHYHYTTWPDFGVPRSPFAFLKFLRDVRQSDAFNPRYGPPIVHCSAGIGRSGTFCLVDSCLISIEKKGVDCVNVAQVLLQMRKYRMGLIQTPEQLRFSYVALLQGLKVDWKARDEEGLPLEEDSLYINNGNKSSSFDSKISDSEDDTPPPLPPPRNLSFQPEKPLPGSPSDSSSDSSIENADENESSDDDRCSSANRFDDEIFSRTPLFNRIAQTSPSVSVPESRKRKYSTEASDKTQRISDKLQEMKKKQNDAEKWKKQRSILINLSLGISVVAVSGVVIAYFWYGKNS